MTGKERRLGDSIPIPGDYQYRALHQGSRVQRYWHRAKLELFDWAFDLLPGERVLDVGCGSGVVADRMARTSREVLGIDGNARAIAFARRTFERPGVSFQEGLLDDLDLPSASFDSATCLEIVEHVHPPQVRDLLRSLRRIVRPGGRLLLTTPNYRGTWPLVEWLADRMADTAHMDGDQHVTHFDRRMLVRQLEASGFELLSVRTYCTFAPFAAAFSSALARRLDRFERRADLPFGNLLVAVARNPRLPHVG